jgi:hypothetical protein
VDGPETSVGKDSKFEGKRVTTERAAMVPTIAAMDTSQGKRRRRRNRKAGRVGRIGSVTMPTKSKESGGQATKVPHLASVDNLNGFCSVSVEAKYEEVFLSKET